MKEQCDNYIYFFDDYISVTKMTVQKLSLSAITAEVISNNNKKWSAN